MKHQKIETLPEISKRMSQVKLKRGVAETMLAKTLWHCGVRYRLNYRALAGSPDIAITKQKIAVFIDGEFWHGHDWNTRKQKLKRNREYWIEKIEENIARDKRNDELLKTAGWSVVHFWEKEVMKNLDTCAEDVIKLISMHNRTDQKTIDVIELQSALVSDSLVADPSIEYAMSNKTVCSIFVRKK